MLGADAVVGTAQPCFEIGEHKMDDGQKIVSLPREQFMASMP